MIQVALIGAGSLGVQLAHQLALAGIHISGFYDDVLSRGTDVNGHRVLGGTPELLAGNGPFTHALMAIGYAHMAVRQQLFEQVAQAGIPFHTLVHPSAIVDPSATIGQGAVVFPGCIIDRSVNVQANALLNNGCIISHDSIVGAHSFLAPGVVVSGNVTIGTATFVGSGTVFRDGVRTGTGCRFGAGSVVVKDALLPGTYFGNPAAPQRT